MSRRRRVLVLIQGPLGDRLAGPEIRGWEVARAFAARGHDVTAMASVLSPTTREGIPVLPRTRGSIFSQTRRHDVVIGPVIPPYALLAGRRCLHVADLYDPVEFELATVGGRRARRHVAQQRASVRLQQRWAGIVVCANERQRERLQAQLDALEAPAARADRAHGLARAARARGWASAARALPRDRRRRPARAVVGQCLALARRTHGSRGDRRCSRPARPDIRFVITAGKPSNAATDKLNVAEDVRALARRRGLLDRHVFFLDEWVPFDQRHRYLGDADVGITLHAATAEATLAARARYMDYVWASVPSVLAEGDEVADRLAEAGAARLVPPRDAEATARALDELLADPEQLAAARRACTALAAEYLWPNLLAPLVDHVEAAEPVRRSLGQDAAVALEAARYYAGRAIDRGLQALPAG